MHVYWQAIQVSLAVMHILRFAQIWCIHDESWKILVVFAFADRRSYLRTYVLAHEGFRHLVFLGLKQIKTNGTARMNERNKTQR